MSRPKQYDDRVAFNIRMDPEVHARLLAAAEERGVSGNWLAHRAVADYLDRLIPPDEIQWTRDP